MGIATLSLFLATVAIMLAEGFSENFEEFDRSPASPIVASISDRATDSDRCKNKKACSRKGGRCVKEGTCQTVEIEAKCGKKDGNSCKCCAKALKNRCRPCSQCKEDGGFCVMNKKACAKGTLRKDECHCKKGKEWRRGHCCIPPVTSPSWGYMNDSYGPDNWSESFPKCAGNNQSPINVDEGYPWTELNLAYDPWVFTGYDIPATPNEITVKNNGHYVTIDWSEAAPASIKGGYLGAEYTFQELQLHWGRNTTEHFHWDGFSFELELHFVHYKAEYGNIITAMEHSDGLAIMAVPLFEVASGQGFDNSQFLPITDAFSSIIEPNSEKTVTFPYSLKSLAGVENPDWEIFRRYSGSLTSPPCSEVVTWTIFQMTSTMPFNQYNAFRSLKFEDSTAMVYNNRPIQPLNSREVYLVS